MGSGLGIGREDPRTRRVRDEPALQEKERAALEYADAITLTDRDVDDDLFEKVRGHFGEDAVVELTATIAWENSSSKFNRACVSPRSGCGNGEMT